MGEHVSATGGASIRSLGKPPVECRAKQEGRGEG
jgi:hypothetical protein